MTPSTEQTGEKSGRSPSNDSPCCKTASQRGAWYQGFGWKALALLATVASITEKALDHLTDLVKIANWFLHLFGLPLISRLLVLR
jgi:hypothetical protein